MYRRSGRAYDEFRLDYLFLDSQYYNSDRFVNGFRIGRIKLPLGIYNDTRDIAFTRPSAYLSQSVYQDITKRNMLLSGDGANLNFNFFTERGQWNFSFIYSQPENKYLRNTTLLAPQTESLIDFDIQDSSGYQYRISYTDDIGLTISLSGLDKPDLKGLSTLDIGGHLETFFGIPYRTILVDVDTEMDAHVDILSLQYATKNWEFTLEYALTQKNVAFSEEAERFSELLTLSNILPDGLEPIDNIESESYYIQVMRRLNQYVELFARYDIYYYDRHDPDGSEFAYNDSSIPYSRADNSNTEEMIRYWNMVHVTFAYRF